MAYPAAFLREAAALLDEAYGDFEAALDAPPTRALRLNPARPQAEALVGARLDGVVPWCADGRYLEGAYRPARDPVHIAGGVYMQDASAMAAAAALAAQPGERVLDLCAAPGGKSGQIAAALAGSGLLVANEPQLARARILSANLERLGAANAVVVSATPQTLASHLPGFFDAVLVDAPCSGEGMFRRDEAARAEWTPERSAGCAVRQAEILREAAKLVRPGGRLVYSTCTFNRRENEDVIAGFLREQADFSPVDFALSGVGASENGCLRLWPHRLRGEGHFVAKTARAADEPPATPKAGTSTAAFGVDSVSARRSVGTRVPPAAVGADSMPARRPATPNAADALARVSQILPGAWIDAYARWTPRLIGDTLWLLPPETPDLSGLYILRAGLCVARDGAHPKPEHALAMAARGLPAFELTDAMLRAYLRGEELPATTTGWRVAAWRGLPFGFGKGAGGAFKNHLPKGLRVAEVDL